MEWWSESVSLSGSVPVPDPSHCGKHSNKMTNDLPVRVRESFCKEMDDRRINYKLCLQNKGSTLQGW